MKRIPLRDFFRNPEKSRFQISPSGARIAFFAPFENRRNIFVQERGKPDAQRLTSAIDRDISDFFWKGDDAIIYARDFDGDENFHLFLVSLRDQREQDLTPFPNVKCLVVDPLEEDDSRILFAMNQRDAQLLDVYRLNIETGERELVAENPGGVIAWLADHDGQVRLGVQSDGVNKHVLYRASEREPFSTIVSTTFRDTFLPQCFTFDNREIYALSNIGRDTLALVRFNPETKREVEVLFERSDVDASGVSYSRKRKTLTAVGYALWKSERHFLDADTQAIAEKLASRLPNQEFLIASMTRDESLWVVETRSDRSLGASYLYDARSDTLEKLADHAPWLNPDDLCEMKPIQYRSRDGLTIHGYLTLPKNLEPKRLPVVVNPHGGPWWRDYWGFQPHAQFLANRGYAVLQMNFRGSIGYGKKFWELSFKEWGGKMQDDITDGVQWLIEQGIADPKRVAIFGGSYGGYATLAGLAFTPDLYACGVDFCGVSNLFTFLNAIPPYWKPMLDMMHEMIGNPETEPDLLRARSPIFHVDNIKAPLFVAQGAKDPRVRIEESDQIVEALRRRGVEVEYLVKENEGHGFQNEENRIEFFERMERFLSRHLS
ncbi:MAG: S9 family peptidase [Chloroherpetonaceae bacterium]|nr:S9 family peptidase [Chloroherpetonaceae bacterium]MDW8437428.1 S9 family peptidase [Chloroherpetonaceae bacterium]